jgi:3-phenylpropionate/trans-cinnamate dioxygenase ferredoxin subunit
MTRLMQVGTVDDLEPGQRISVQIEEGLFVAIFNVGGAYYAIEDRCTHDDGPLADGALDGFEVECPRHGARFDIRDGKVRRFPAVTPVRRFEVKIIDRAIMIELD